MDQEKLDKLIDDLAGDFSDAVKEIESGIKTTQNNYGRYMSLLSSLSKGNKRLAEIFSLAMIKAGANAQGVNSAMRILYPN